MTLLELLQLLRKHLRLVVALPIACAVAVAAYSVLFMPNTYTASTSMYVLAQNNASTDASNLSQYLNASQMLTNDVAKLLQSDRIVAKTGKQVGVPQLRGYKVNVASETTSRVITLTVTGPDPQIAASAANDMVKNVSDVAQQVMSIEAVNSIDGATAPSMLAAEHAVQEAAIPVGISSRLFFLDAEPGIPNPADVLQSKRFHALLSQLSGQFDYVIVDTPPVTTFVNAAVAASVVDATILVACQDYMHRDDGIAAYDQLVQAGANVVGTVLNCCDATTSGHYYGYYKERRNDSYDVVAPSAGMDQPLGAAPAATPAASAR